MPPLRPRQPFCTACPATTPFLTSQPRSDRLLRVEEIRVRGADRRNFRCLFMCFSQHHAHGALCRLYRFVARPAARGQPRYRARRQGRIEGGGLHPGVPVRKSPGARGDLGRRRKGSSLMVLAPRSGFSRNAGTDIRAPAFPAFRVCGLPRVRGLHRFRDEEIAARFFLNTSVVKQRLRLAAVSRVCGAWLAKRRKSPRRRPPATRHCGRNTKRWRCNIAARPQHSHVAPPQLKPFFIPYLL